MNVGQIQSSILVFHNYQHLEWSPISTHPWLFHQLWSHSVKTINDTKIMLSKSTDLTKAVGSVFWLSHFLRYLKFTPIQLSSSTLRIHLQASFIENFVKMEVLFKLLNKVWLLWLWWVKLDKMDKFNLLPLMTRFPMDSWTLDTFSHRWQSISMIS